VIVAPLKSLFSSSAEELIFNYAENLSFMESLRVEPVWSPSSVYPVDFS